MSTLRLIRESRNQKKSYHGYAVHYAVCKKPVPCLDAPHHSGNPVLLCETLSDVGDEVHISKSWNAGSTNGTGRPYLKLRKNTQEETHAAEFLLPPPQDLNNGLGRSRRCVDPPHRTVIPHSPMYRHEHACFVTSRTRPSNTHWFQQRRVQSEVFLTVIFYLLVSKKKAIASTR